MLQLMRKVREMRAKNNRNNGITSEQVANLHEQMLCSDLLPCFHNGY